MDSHGNYRHELVQKRVGRELAPDFLDDFYSQVDWKKVIEALNIKLNYPKVCKTLRGNRIKRDMILRQGRKEPYIPCPFHDDTTPSLHFDFQRKYFYCFGCHVKGSILEFVKKYKQINFHQAIDLSMRYSGIKIRKRFVNIYEDDLKTREIEGPTQEQIDRELETYILHCKSYVGDRLD